MKIKEIIEILQKYDPEMRALIFIDYKNDKFTTEHLRDILDYKNDEYVETILFLTIGSFLNNNERGYEKLTAEKWQATKEQIVKEVNNPSYKFWKNGTRYGTYLIAGGTQDRCWTCYYDPRMWQELAAEGRIDLTRAK